MTIVFFARRFYPLIGGVEKHVFEISKRLVKRGHRVIVITEYENNTNSKNQHSYSKSAMIEGIEILRIKAGKEGVLKKFRVWLGLLKYLNLIKSADIIHCHDIFYWYLPFRLLFPFKKVYTTFHGYEGNNMPSKRAIFMHKLSEVLSFGNICVGDFLKKWYGTKPNFVTYGAVSEVMNKGLGIKDDSSLMNIVYLGRLEKEAGIMEYLKAFREISKKYKNLKLIILGDGSEMNKAKEFTRKSALNVQFRGFVKNINTDLERASFVFTSRYLGILESLMSKKYVLAVYNNEIKKDYLEMAPFSKFISISSNSLGIKNELEKYLLDINAKRMKINKGYEWVKYQTWEQMTEMYLKLWMIN